MDFKYSDVDPLARFITETGKILPRKETGLSAKHQRRITNRITQTEVKGGSANSSLEKMQERQSRKHNANTQPENK